MGCLTAVVVCVLASAACGCDQPPIEVQFRNTELSFRPLSPSATGEHPNALVIADLDADGDSDVLVPGLVTPEIAMFRNDGDGLTTRLLSNALSVGATDSIIADLNDDGTVELVAVVRDDNRLVLLGVTAQLELAPLISQPVDEPWYAVAADIDGDRGLELAVSRFGPRDIVIYDVDANLQLRELARIPVDGKPTVLTTCDLTGDSRPEIVTAESASGHIRVLAGRGAVWGTLARAEVGGWPSSIRCADLDGDGELELVGTSNLGDTVFIAELHRGRFTSELEVRSIPAGHGAFDVAVADLDGDGQPDLAVTNKFEDTLTIFRNLGAGDFESATTFPTGWGPSPVRALHVDDDGNLDLAVINAFDNNVQLFLSAPAPLSARSP